jgi:hypothetical protein
MNHSASTPQDRRPTCFRIDWPDSHAFKFVRKVVYGPQGSVHGETAHRQSRTQRFANKSASARDQENHADPTTLRHCKRKYTGDKKNRIMLARCQRKYLSLR